jgi:hypothetical protein
MKIALREVSEIQMGFTARERLQPSESGTNVIQLRDLTADGMLDTAHLIKCELGKVSPRYLVNDGDILFRSRGERNTAALVAGLTAASVAVLPLVIIRPRGTVIDPSYLSWFMNSEWAQGYFDKAAQGTKLRMISRNDLESLPIEIPALATQRRIVEVERLATEERRLSLQLINLRQQLLSSTLRRLAEKGKTAMLNNKHRND